MKKLPSPFFFSIPYKNTDVWFIDFSGLKKKKDRKREVMDIIESILPKIIGGIDVVIQYHETALNKSDVKDFFSFFEKYPDTFSRVVFSGSGILNHLRIRLAHSRIKRRINFLVLYQDDLEMAKTLAVN